MGAAVMMMSIPGCADVPDDVKENTENEKTAQNAQEDDIVKIPISDIDDDSQKLYDYVEQNGYGDKFVLDDNITVNSVDRLYNLKLRQVSDFQENFPTVYNYLFGDFEEDSGVTDIDSLPISSVDELDTPFFQNDDSSWGKTVQFIDLDTVTGTSYTTSLDLTETGFFYFEQNYDYLDSYGYTDGASGYNTDDEFWTTQFVMQNGESYTPMQAMDFANEAFGGLMKELNPDFEYKVAYARSLLMENDCYSFNLEFHKYYDGVPFVDWNINSQDQFRPKYMYYEAKMYNPDSFTMIDLPFGVEDLVSSEEITEDIIPLTTALDLLNKELAPNIRLEIKDIKLMYYNEYDAADAIKAQEKSMAQEPLTSDEQMALMGGLARNQEYSCFPVWAFYIDNSQELNEYGYESALRSYDYLYVDAQTGEVVNYIE